MLGKLPFRTKLILVVSLPLFALIGFAGITISSRYNALSSEQQYGHVVPAFQALARLGRSVSDEGVASHWFVHTPSGDPPPSKALIFDTRNATDDAITALQQALPSLPGQVTGRTLTQVRAINTAAEHLQAATRAAVDAHVDPGAVFNTVAADSLTAAASVARDVNDHGLSTSLLGVVDLRRSQVAGGDEASVVVNWMLGSPGDLAAWDAAVHDQDNDINAFLATATTAEARAYQNAPAVDTSDLLRATTPGALPAAFPAVRPDIYTYMNAFLARQSGRDQAINAVQNVVDHTAASNESSARTQLGLAAGGTALLIALVLGLAWLLVQAVNRPLRALTRAARNVSERRLPQLVETVRAGGELSPDQREQLAPIPVASNDEIGALAQAFSNIQRVAVEVAEEQAALLRKGIGDLYVNLARRNQSLLDRQLALLDDLEREAADPDDLSALFELDHLSTRMRRNAESLLVLAGAEQPRQWRTAIPIIDVVRAAGAEIADFARVSYIGFLGDLAVAGNAVADVTHLLAELLENATAFSPPATPVVVSGAPSERRYVITITDEGLGIDDERLARINALLARPPAPGLALSRTLGLHVVAHLAARHGIYVQLRKATPVGVTALVALPSTILARTGADAPAAPPPPPPEPEPEGPALILEPVSASATTSSAAADARPTIRFDDVPAPVAAAPEPAREPEAPVSPEPAPEPAPVRAVAPEPVNGTAEPALPRRGGGPDNGNGDLATRVPGANLTHRPSPPPEPSPDTRPRPERVHDLLTRHARGVREGREDQQ